MARREPNYYSCLVAAILAIAIFWTEGSRADSEAPLTVGWALSPPAYEFGPEGEHTGYFIELARLLGDRIGLDVKIKRFNGIAELANAQASGETDLIAGSPRLEFFKDSNVFSLSVGPSRYVLFGLAARLNELDPWAEKTMRVAILPGNPAAVEEYMESQIEVPTTSPGEALFSLLSRDIDAVLFPEELIQAWSYNAGIDHLFLPISEPVAQVPRKVILHESRANLLPAINMAIVDMEADGSLPALRKKYLMKHLDPEPEVLTVAIPEISKELEFAPYYLLNEDGEFSGFVVELFRKLADKADLKYQFKVTSFAKMTQGPDASEVDIIPLFALPTDVPGQADYTLPTEELIITATVRQTDNLDMQTLGDLSGKTVGVLYGTYGHRMALKDKSLSVIAFVPGDQLLDALLDGSIDAALENKGYVLSKAKRRNLTSAVRELSPELYRSERGILLRFGLGRVRERLDREIGSYLLTDDYLALKRKYFGTPVFWTDTRQHIAVAGATAAAMLILAFGSALIMSDGERRRAERANAEARKANGDAERARSEAEASQRHAVLGQLTGGVAHDFNNLLAIILSRQELMRDEIADPALLRHVDASIGAANRGADLTRSMLAFARKAPLQPRKVEINKMVEDTREWTARTIASNITVETVLTEGLCSIEVDLAAAQSALLNLVLNARDAMPNGGTLTIKTSSVAISEVTPDKPDTLATGSYVVLSVSDTGQGIPAENLSRIFDPFFTTKSMGEGSGLGLSMIQGFMEQSGGAVLVRSDSVKGTTFHLYFPCRTALIETENIDSAKDMLVPNGQRILLVEDNTGVLAVLNTMLCNAGYAVSTADSGDRALEVFAQDPHFDLVLTDVMMPGNLNGVNLAITLRKLVPGLPVITMSGYSDTDLADNNAGIDSLRLYKPVSRSTLLDAVHEALDGSLRPPS